MRLTLRTLLAYLDDTLEPTEAKLIGQKVAESDTAQELIARLREVTRRRRITTPTASGPGAKVDPNTIAEYLDNELTAEALAEVEQLALSSDVYLAEVAACHQILTIVLGEPANVPPTAFKRMYGLVRTAESNPRHRAPGRRDADEPVSEGKDVDETLRLGMPALRGGASWTNRLILLGGAAAILLLLALAVWQLLPPLLRDSGDNVVRGTDTGRSLLPGLGTEKKEKTGKSTDTKAKADTGTGKDKEPDPKEKQPDPKEKQPDPKEKEPEPKKEEEAPPPPLPGFVEIGHYEPPLTGTAPVLLQLLADKKQPGRQQWTRLLRSKDQVRVLTNAPLVSLPGYRSVVQMDSGVRLTLWGNLPEIAPFPIAMESAVLLHPNDQFDLDLTLQRGRIALANPKDQPLKVRLRFANPTIAGKQEVWDLTLLEKGADVIVNLVGHFPPGEPFYRAKDNPNRAGPMAVIAMLVRAGSAQLKFDLRPPEKLTPPPEGAVVLWDSRTGQQKFFKPDIMPPWTDPEAPPAKGFDKARAAVLGALGSLNTELSGQSVDKGLLKALESNDLHKRRLAVRCAGAIDDLQRIMDTMVDKELAVRHAAIETLRIWIAAERDNDYRLYEALQPTYSPVDAETMLSLLHTFSPLQEADPSIHSLLVNYLTHKKVAIRELAHDYLLKLFPDGAKVGFNATAPDAQVRQQAMQWQAIVEQGGKK